MKKRWIGVVLGAMMAFAIGMHTVNVRAESYYDQVENETIDQDGYFVLKVDSVVELKRALAYRSEEGYPTKVVVKPGTYTLYHSLYINSNTYLYAEGATFEQDKGTVANMLYVGEKDNTATGYYYENITFDGGVWNEKGNSNTLLKIGHAKNVSILNMELKNVKNSHLVEVAGVDGFTVNNCTFSDQELNNDKQAFTYEAIQLDILASKHFKNYVHEDLNNKNITVTECTFTNVPRGIGSHTAILNNPMKNVVISNNTFSKIKSCAIQLLYVENCEIEKNTIKSAPRGITVFGAVYSKQDTYLGSTLAEEGGTTSDTSEKYKTPTKNMKITISDNSINISGKDAYAAYEKCGIWLEGTKYTSATKNSSGDTLPKGNYYVSGVTISRNVVKGNANGIKLNDVRSCSVSKNEVTFTGKHGAVKYYGIAMKEGSKTITVKKNSASGYLNNIYVKDSSASDILSNTVKNAKKYGIGLERSTGTTISKNIVNKAKVNGINIWDKSKVDSIKGNTIKAAKKKGICVAGGSKAKKISGNKISGCGQDIYVAK